MELLAYHVRDALASAVCNADRVAERRSTPDATAVAVDRGLCFYRCLARFRGALGLGVRSPEHLRERSWTVVGGAVGGLRQRLRPAALAASSHRTMAMLHIPRDLHRGRVSWDCRSHHPAVRPASFCRGERGVSFHCGRRPHGSALRPPRNRRIPRRRASASGMDARTSCGLFLLFSSLV